MDAGLVIVLVIAIAVAVLLLSVKSLVVICQPSEVVIFSGPPKREGARVGYRAVRGGRGLRIPMFEIVSRLDVSNMSVEVAVRGAYTREGVPLNVQGVANLKIDGDAPGLDNAVERLLGKSRDEIAKMGRETLEGNLRGVLARLTPEQVNEDKESFARELIEEAEADLGRLGLLLDTLKIQTVADEVGYLDSIGRKQGAVLIRRSRIAEAERQSEAVVQSAMNMQRTRVAQIAAETEINIATANRRIVKATSSRPAVVAQERSAIESQIARAEAEVGVQKARIEQVRVQLEADLVAPARAYRLQMEAQAQADTAAIRESGMATAEGLKQLAERWREAGDSAREIFLLEKLRTLVGIMVGTVKNARVDQITFVGSGGDAGTPMAGKVASLMEQLRASGIDVPELLSSASVGMSAIGQRAPVRASTTPTAPTPPTAPPPTPAAPTPPARSRKSP